MRKPIEKKLVLLLLACVVSIGLAGAVQKAGSYKADRDSYIDVGGGTVTYVPRTTEYVKYNGKVRKIAKFASTLTEGEKDCKCPKCCDGYCYIIIYTDSLPGSSPIIILSVIWFRC